MYEIKSSGQTTLFHLPTYFGPTGPSSGRKVNIGENYLSYLLFIQKDIMNTSPIFTRWSKADQWHQMHMHCLV
jgi:hypothetical protein